MQHKELTASQIEKLTLLNKHSIKKYLQVLVEQKLILKRGKGRATTYIPV